MLDDRSYALLKIINGECAGQGYKIFGTRDLALSLPQEYAADTDGVRETLKNLADREYISVKYEDEAEVCLKPLAKGRLAFERRIDEELETSRSEKKYFVWSFLGAVCGGAAVSLVVAAIFFIARLAAC